MTDLTCFLMCVFGVLVLVSGLSTVAGGMLNHDPVPYVVGLVLASIGLALACFACIPLTMRLSGVRPRFNFHLERVAQTETNQNVALQNVVNEQERLAFQEV